MQITAAHWVYLAGVVIIIVTMVLRKNIVVPAVVATFITALVFSHSVIRGLASVFDASLVAAQNLFNIFLIIALVTAMLHALQAIGADRKMVAPFRRIMRNGHFAFWTLVVITYFISLFFWPTPAVPLIGAVLIPVAIRAGMRPMAVGMTIAIAGQGMALSSDYVIRVAPGLSAKAAGVSTNAVADEAMVLSLVVGGIALAIGYLMEFRKMRKPAAALLTEWIVGAKRKSATSNTEDGSTLDAEGATVVAGEGERELVLAGTGAGDTTAGGGGAGGEPQEPDAPTIGHGVALERDYGDTFSPGGEPDTNVTAEQHSRISSFFAVFVPLAYLTLIAYMVLASSIPTMPQIAGGDAAALVGGVAALIVFLISLVADGKNFLDTSATHVVDGLVFAFKAMGVVVPIAGFFFLGNGEFAGKILGMDDPMKGPSFLSDLVLSAEQHIPNNAFIATFGILIIGMVAGLEGSGFSGLPLTGSLAGSLGATAGVSATSLAAVGQMGNIWSGGGTLVAWSSLIAIAGFARVPVIDLARRCFIPVCCGLAGGAVFSVLFFS